MSKMSQLHAELTMQAAELGFESIEEAEANGYKVDYDKQKLIQDIEQAYEDLADAEKSNKESKRIEMVYEVLGRAKDMIAMIYKPDDVAYCNPSKHITDADVQDYYYQINDMCCELSDRNVMLWQKEDNEN